MISYCLDRPVPDNRGRPGGDRADPGRVLFGGELRAEAARAQGLLLEQRGHPREVHGHRQEHLHQQAGHARLAWQPLRRQ